MKTSMSTLALGMVAGAVVTWIWGDRIKRYADDRTRDLRTRAADGLQVVQDKAEGVIDTARDQIHSTLQAGQEAVRPHLSRVGSGS